MALQDAAASTSASTSTVTECVQPATTATSKSHMSESDRMRELIKKAIKSVAAYNSQLQKEIREERRKYFDLQTMVRSISSLPASHIDANQTVIETKRGFSTKPSRSSTTLRVQPPAIPWANIRWRCCQASFNIITKGIFCGPR